MPLADEAQTETAASILNAIGACKVVLCAGPGGVGKTTTSAALALAAARAGQRALVLTIDPARRLADALGVGLGNEPRRIDEAVLRDSGLTLSGELWAVMLDSTRTFDDLIQRLSVSPERARSLLDNVVYRQISRALAGTLEYTAIEKLYDLRCRNQFDLIVVDTPPSKNVLDFLEAPEYISRFLDERILKWFLILDPTQEGGGLRRRLLQRTGRVVWEVLSRIFGAQFLGEIVEFMRAIEGMVVELRHRADTIADLLRSPDALFVIVSTPERSVLGQAALLWAEIARRQTRFGGFIVNRTHPDSGLQAPAEAARIVRDAAGEDPAAERLAAKLITLCHELDARARRDKDAVDHLRRLTGWNGFLATLPRQLKEINDLVELHELSLHLHP